MPRARKKQKDVANPAAPAASGAPIPTVANVGDLAWAGRHALAIQLATTALAAAGPNAALKLDLLDLRAESLIALGDSERAGADASAMLDLAASAAKPRVSGAGPQPAGVGADAQRQDAGSRTNRHVRAERGAKEQAAGGGSDEPVSLCRSAVPREGCRARGSERETGCRTLCGVESARQPGASAMGAVCCGQQPGTRGRRRQGCQRSTGAGPAVW